MKIQALLYFIGSVIACSLHAETVWDSQDSNAEGDQHRQRLSLGYRMNYNISAKFGNLGGFPGGSNPGPATGSNVDRTYDNGFNRVDSSGNAGGKTWFWGYNNANQIVGDSIVMTSRSSSANASSEASDDPQHGMELTYNLELGGNKKWRWGFEASANYTAVNISDSGTAHGNVTLISDAFALNGVLPPAAPYSGTFVGPGPVIDSTPVRNTSTIAGGATVAGQRDLDANLWGLRLGPYLELPISHRIALSFSGGLALVEVSSDFSFNESVTIRGAGSVSRAGSSSDDELLAGGYISGNFLYHLTENISLSTGIQYYAVGTHEQQANGKSAELDLSGSLGILFGARYSF